MGQIQFILFAAKSSNDLYCLNIQFVIWLSITLWFCLGGKGNCAFHIQY